MSKKRIKRLQTSLYPLHVIFYDTLHSAPFNIKEVGEGLLPLHEPLKPGLAEEPAGIEPL